MKKNLCLLIIILFLIPGCVSMTKYNELKDRNTALAKESAKLQQSNRKLADEAAELKKSREALQGELQAMRKVPDYYYQRGIEHFSGKNYRTAADYFEIVVDRYPLDPAAAASREKLREIAAISAENYKRTTRNIDAAKDPKIKVEILDRDIAERFFTKDDAEKLLNKREIYSNELSLIEEMNKHILVEEDPTQSVRYFRTTRPTIQEISNEKSFNVELYIVQQFSGKKRFRIKARYIGDNWISYDSISLRGENGSHVDIICKYPEKLSKMSEDKIYEWSDNDVDEGRMNALLKSGTITVRFGGGYRFGFSLNDEQMTAFREIAKKYSTLR
ncbi:MAG: hypothetical protein ABFD62_01280 [Syntrophaceae bacterium]